MLTVAGAAVVAAILTVAAGGCAWRRAPEPVPADRPIRVMTWRAGMFLGGDGRIDLARAAAIIRTWRPDILHIQDIDRGTIRALAQDQPADLAAELGMPFHWLELEAVDRGRSGLATFTHLPVLEVLERTHEMPIQPGRPAGALGLRVPWGGRTIVAWNVAVPDADVAVQYAHLRWLGTLAQSALRGGDSPVFAGTFGLEPGTTPFDAMTEGLVDTWPGLGTGRGYTAPSVRARSRVDYVWIEDGGPIVAHSIYVINASGLAAHLPVVADLLLRPEAEAAAAVHGAPARPDDAVMEPDVPLDQRGGRVQPGERLPETPDGAEPLPGVTEPFRPRGRPTRP